MLSRFAVVCAAAALTLTAQPVAAHAIGGGSAVTDAALRFIVKIDVGDGDRSCTGALVTPWWVLTAASCAGTAAGAPAQRTTVTAGRLDLTSSAGLVVGVDRVVPYEGRDVALARLARPAFGVPTVPLAAVPPAVGDAVVAAGYGRTGDTWVPDALHAGEVTVDAVGAAALDVSASGGTTICKGDAGGPALRRTGSGYELVGVHVAGAQGGCLGESATAPRTAVDARVDDLRVWVTQTAVTPAAQQVALTSTRIGLLTGDYGTRVKEGGLSALWTLLLADAKQVVVDGSRVGVLTHAGVAYVNDGATTAAFVNQYSNVRQLALSGNRIGVVTEDGVALVKEGGLSALWTTEYTGVQSMALSGDRIGIVTNAGAAMVKAGSLHAFWVTQHTGVRQLALSGDRIGVVHTDGVSRVKAGGLSAFWTDQASAGTATLSLSGDRIGLLTTDGVAKVKDGGLDAAFVTQYSGVRQLDIAADRIGVVTLNGPALVKDGGLSAQWTTVWP